MAEELKLADYCGHPDCDALHHKGLNAKLPCPWKAIPNDKPNNTFWCVVAINKEDNSQTVLFQYARDTKERSRNAVRDYAWKTEQFTGNTELRLKQLNWEIREFDVVPVGKPDKSS